jgi:hypothetical protein
MYARKKHFDRKVPSADTEFKNLHEYKEYRDNENRIKKAEFVQFSYWIDSLVLPNNQIYDPVRDKDLTFEYIRFYVQIAKCKNPGMEQSLDSNYFEPYPNQRKILLAEYIRPKVVDFYKTPENIIQIPDSTAQILDVLLRENPYYYFVDEYGKMVGQTAPIINFPYMESRYDLVVRYSIAM